MSALEPPPELAASPTGRHTLDFAPLRHRDFRLLVGGRGVSDVGGAVTEVALAYQVYRLTHSSLLVGTIGAVELAAILGLAALGGVLADAVDRRRLVLASEVALAAASVVLLANAELTHPSLLACFLAAFLAAGAFSVQRPSLDALLSRLVPDCEQAAASAIRSMSTNIAILGGPALSGVLLAAEGPAGAYGLDVASFSVSTLTLTLLLRGSSRQPPADSTPPSLAGMRAGLRYARSRRDLVGTYLVDGVAMLFGMPTALFPALSVRLGGPTALGLLYAAPAAGAVLAGMLAGGLGRVRRQGLAVCWAAIGWGLAIVGLGLAPDLGLALACLAGAGAADMASALYRTLIWNRTIPDALRGRLAAIELVSYAAGPALSGPESGGVAAAIGVTGSIVSGGLLCVAGVVAVALALPDLRRFVAPAGPVTRPSG